MCTYAKSSSYLKRSAQVVEQTHMNTYTAKEIPLANYNAVVVNEEQARFV